MTNQIASNTANSAKTLAKQIAMQMAKEPIELLKDVKEQATGDSFGATERPAESLTEEDHKRISDENNLADKLKSGRLIEALNRELADIQKQKLFQELQARISEGEEIPLYDYTELSMEQKQVLMAQMEAVKTRRAMQATAGYSDVPAIQSKPSRRFGAGQKQQAQKEQTRVEKPVPPSG